MPTLLRFGAFRIVIYTLDHEPAHVHVEGRGVLAILLLHCEERRCSVRESLGMSPQELRTVMRFVDENVAILCQKWSELHGQRTDRR